MIVVILRSQLANVLMKTLLAAWWILLAFLFQGEELLILFPMHFFSTFRRLPPM